MATGFFVRQNITEHTVALPGLTSAKATARARLEREGADDEAIAAELAALDASMTCTVRLRPLNAGEMARINEIRVDQGGGVIPIGEGRLLAVELALVGWSLDQPPTADTIKQLNPVVFQRIYDLVDVGGDPDDVPPTREQPPALLELAEPAHEPGSNADEPS